MSPELSLIIVHYQAPDFLRRCIDSIPAAAGEVPYEIVVVDNGSENSNGLIKAFPGARWVQNGENVGLSKAVNRGAEASSGKIIVLLNQDLQLLPGSLDALSRFFNERPSEPLGAIGGRLLFSDGRHQPSCGPFPGLGNLLWRLPLPREQRRYYLRKPGDGQARVDWVTGAYLAVRRTVFDQLGGFDPDFFLYYEDVDFCLRASKTGFPSYYVPEAAAYHHNPHAARENVSAELRRLIQSSREFYFKKHRPLWENWALSMIQSLERTVKPKRGY